MVYPIKPSGFFGYVPWCLKPAVDWPNQT